MKLSLIPAALQPIAEKIERQERITDDEALTLYRSTDINALGIMASEVR
jgi:2-iminoacetate synthase ThiH